MVNELDANPACDQTVFIYRLKNAQALNVESVVNGLFNGTGAAIKAAPPARTNWAPIAAPTAREIRARRRLWAEAAAASAAAALVPVDSEAVPAAAASAAAVSASFGGGFGGFGGLSQSAMGTASSLAGQVVVIARSGHQLAPGPYQPQRRQARQEVLKELDRPVGQVLIKVLIAEVTHDNTLDIGEEV